MAGGRVPAVLAFFPGRIDPDTRQLPQPPGRGHRLCRAVRSNGSPIITMRSLSAELGGLDFEGIPQPQTLASFLRALNWFENPLFGVGAVSR